MSVICGISTYHLIDTSSPCRLICAELSSAWLPGHILSFTARAEKCDVKGQWRGMQAAWKGMGSQSEPPKQRLDYWTICMQVTRIFMQVNVTKSVKKALKTLIFSTPLIQPSNLFE